MDNTMQVMLGDIIVAQPLEAWHEDFGDVLWWTWPVTEPPHCGSPLASDWPGYHTHWTRFIVPPCALTEKTPLLEAVDEVMQDAKTWPTWRRREVGLSSDTDK